MDEKKIEKAATNELAEQLFTLFLLAGSGASLDDIEKKLDEMIAAGNARAKEQEQKPKEQNEPKFKVGDRVLVVFSDAIKKYAPHYIAKSGTVKGVDKTMYGSVYAVDFDLKIHDAHTCGGLCRKKHGEWFAEDELKKLEKKSAEQPKPEEQYKPKFKPGDRVRAIGNSCSCAPVGAAGVVKNVRPASFARICLSAPKDEPSYSVEFDKPFDAGHICGGVCSKKRGQYMCESCLEPLTADADNSNKGFTVVVESKGDITIAKYLVGGKVEKQTAVKRYYKDKYSVNAAIKYSLEKLMNKR